MTLGVLAMALVVAAAGAGRLDWLPSQTYFPASLRNAIPVHCTDADENKVEEMAPIDEFEAEWFSNELRAAGEPSLYLASQTPVGRSTETYRFTWLRSFHPKVTVRVDKTGTGAWRLDARRSSGGTEQSPARLKRILRPSEEADLARVRLKSRVLDLPPRDCRGGMDGSRWIIEANERGTYHFANRWTPEDGPVHDFGLLRLGFTGWDLNPIY